MSNGKAGPQPKGGTRISCQPAHSVNRSLLFTVSHPFLVPTSAQPPLILLKRSSSKLTLNCNRLYERAAECIGLDFMSHPFWNRYIEYENRLEQHDRVFAILMRLIHLPLYSYANYFERFRQQSLARPLQDRVPADVFEQWRRELEHHAKSIGQPAESMDEVLQQRTEFYINERYGEISSAVQERWKFEENIKQPFFHVTDVAEPELANWRKYLVFEEQQGDFERIVTLYERCLVTTAQYEEFWLRYVRWMRGQSNESEAVRHILMRASSAFVPVALPAVRLQWALYEEASGRFEIAEDIYSEFLKNSPGHLEVIRAWANAVRRQKGIDDAAGMIREQLRVTELEQETKALMLAELARIYSARSVAEGRQVFEDSKNRNMDVKEFWAEYLLYEIKHTKLESDTKDSPARGVCNEITRTSHLDEQSKNQLVNMYMEHLLESSDSKAATEWLAIDSTANKGTAV